MLWPTLIIWITVGSKKLFLITGISMGSQKLIFIMRITVGSKTLMSPVVIRLLEALKATPLTIVFRV